MILTRKHKKLILLIWWNKIKSKSLPFKGYTGPQIGLKWTKIGQNRGISDILGTDDAI